MKWLVGIGLGSLIPVAAFAANVAASGCCDGCPFC